MDFARARRCMVDSQVLPNRVTDRRVIGVMEQMPREHFIPDAKRSLAYVDEALDIGRGRYLMAGMLVGRLLQESSPNADDVALVIGASGGYLAATLARIVDTVVVVEQSKALAKRATQAFTELGIDNVAVMEGPMNSGLADQSPFDLILFDGAVGHIPEQIAAQLGTDGRLIAMVDDAAKGVMCATLLRCHGDTFSSRVLFEARTPVLPGFEVKGEFVF